MKPVDQDVLGVSGNTSVNTKQGSGSVLGKGSSD